MFQHRHKARLALAGLFSAIGACTVTDYSGAGKRCDDVHLCPGDMVCLGGICHGDADASVPDSGTDPATTYTLTLSSSGNGTTSPAAGSYTYASGTKVQVTATPGSSAMFTGWSGAATGTTNPVTLTMDGNKKLVATFATAYTLTITTIGNGTTSPAEGSITYAPGTVVRVAATPGSGARFTGWSGAATGTTSPVSITMDGNKALTASFTGSNTLTIAAIGNGTTNPASGSYTYSPGVSVQVAASAGSGAMFAGWSGAATGTTNPVTITMDTNKTLAATFATAYTLTIARSGNGTTSPAAGVYTYSSGTAVQVTATPNSGAVFGGWNGAATDTTNPVTITMDANKTLTPSFATAYTLTIAGSGNGTTSPAAGVYTYASGTAVQVAATAGTGAVFTGWNGAATGTTNPVTITMNANKTLTPSFSTSYTLTIAGSDNGTTNPAAGAYAYASGTAVQVTATAGTGAVFTGWSGAATDTTNPVTITMNANKTLTPSFSASSWTLTLATSGNGTTSPTAGSHTYAPGASVRVTATAGSGATFTGWSGATTGTTNPVTVTMDGNKALTANFSGAAQVFSSCEALSAAKPSTPDGTHTLYLQGSASMPYAAYCSGMGTSAPKTYIPLVKTGTDSNYSLFGDGSVKTCFTRIRFDASKMSVNIGDETYATSKGFWPGDSGGADITSVPYAVANSCGDWGYATIDLSGTHFKIASTWTVHGSNAHGQVVLTDSAQYAYIEVYGECGWINPGEYIDHPSNKGDWWNLTLDYVP